jgi:hypothetical protein
MGEEKVIIALIVLTVALVWLVFAVATTRKPKKKEVVYFADLHGEWANVKRIYKPGFRFLYLGKVLIVRSVMDYLEEPEKARVFGDSIVEVNCDYVAENGKIHVKTFNENHLRLLLALREKGK